MAVAYLSYAIESAPKQPALYDHPIEWLTILQRPGAQLEQIRQLKQVRTGVA